MKTIVFASLKGGTGKTTLAAHLAVEATAKGETVVIVDLDAQDSLAEWFNAREAPTPAFKSLNALAPDGSPAPSLRSELDALANAGATLAVVDTPATDKRTLRAALSVADAALMPVRPSPNDLRAAPDTIAEIESTGVPFAFVLSQRITRTKISEQALIALGNLGKTSPAVITARTGYAAAMIDGRTAQEIEPSGPAATEITDLWTFAKGMLQ